MAALLSIPVLLWCFAWLVEAAGALAKGDVAQVPYDLWWAVAVFMLAAAVHLLGTWSDDPAPAQPIMHRLRHGVVRYGRSCRECLAFVYHAPLSITGCLALPFVGWILAALPWCLSGSRRPDHGTGDLVLGFVVITLFHWLLRVQKATNQRVMMANLQRHATLVDPPETREVGGRVGVLWRAGAYWAWDPYAAKADRLERLPARQMPNFWEGSYDVDETGRTMVTARAGRFVVSDVDSGDSTDLYLTALRPYQGGFQPCLVGPRRIGLLARHADQGLCVVHITWHDGVAVVPQTDPWNGDFLAKSGRLRYLGYTGGPWMALLFRQAGRDHFYGYHQDDRNLQLLEVADHITDVGMSRTTCMAYIMDARLVVRSYQDGRLLDMSGPYRNPALSDSGRFLRVLAGRHVCVGCAEDGWALKAFPFEGSPVIFDSGEVLLLQQLASVMHFARIP